MPASLAGRLLLLFAVLLGATLLATTVAALRAANSNVTSLVSEELEIRKGVVRFALEQQAQALREQVDVVTADYAFKAAVATQDRQTVLSALANHGERLDADLAMLLDPGGAITLSSAPLAELPPGFRRAIERASLRSQSLFAVAGDLPYLTVISPVMAPALIGWLVIGEVLDVPALRELGQLTDADLTLRVETASGESATVSTLPIDLVGLASADEIGRFLRDRGWLSRRLSLDDSGSTASPTIESLISVSLSDALADYNPLRIQLVAIAAVGLLLSFVLAVWAARWITRPVSEMVRIAERVTAGDYTSDVTLDSGTELDTLATALNFMQDTVAEREARIQHQAQHDLLTQLPNRNYMFTLYQRYLRESPARAAFGIALIELENLPQLRDLYGSEFSDKVLRAASARLSNSLRRGDMAGRVGDQQILLFLQGIGPDSLDIVLTKIADVDAEPLAIEGIPVRPELRFGFAFSPAHGSDFDDLQRRAQLALSLARAQSQRHAVYTLGQDEKHLRQIRIANRLQRAIADGAFHLQYQPKYHLRERRITGAEALVRWDDEELGRVFPDEFIAIAEQTGVITQLSEWVARQAIADQTDWRRAGRRIATSINLSGIDVLQRGFVDEIFSNVEAAGLPVDALVLEVTETAMMADPELARENMRRVEQMGMRISIDDYGTGFSSLAQLRSLPVRELKLDRSLVSEIDVEEGDRLIVRSTIEMAHHLGLEVVAEGVETPGTLALLAEMQCDYMQGYLLAKPMSSGELMQLLDCAADTTAHLLDALDKHEAA